MKTVNLDAIFKQIILRYLEEKKIYKAETFLVSVAFINWMPKSLTIP